MLKQIVTSLGLAALGVLAVSQAAGAKEIAVCGASVGYGYYPRIGLAASDNAAGKWTDDKISGGRITLVSFEKQQFDVLIADASGSVFSSTQDGGTVLLLERSKDRIAVLVVYPLLAEIYTFLRSETGSEVMWTSNKFGTPVLKVAAYRAPCSFVDPS